MRSLSLLNEKLTIAPGNSFTIPEPTGDFPKRRPYLGRDASQAGEALQAAQYSVVPSAVMRLLQF